MPCGDANNDCQNLIESAAASHNHKTDFGDMCSPLCFCSCCHVSITLSKLFEGITITDFAIGSHTLPAHLLSFASEFFGTIWQPPKIG